MPPRVTPRRVITIDDSGAVTRPPVPTIPARRPAPPPQPALKGRGSPAVGRGAAGVTPPLSPTPLARKAAPVPQTGSLGSRGNSISLSEAVRAVQFPDSNSPETRKYYTMAQMERETVWLVQAARGDNRFLFPGQREHWEDADDRWSGDETQVTQDLDRTLLLAFAGEASDGFLDRRWFQMTDSQLLSEIVPLVMRSGIRTTYPNDPAREGWWSTERGGGFSLIAALDHWVRTEGENTVVESEPDPLAVALGYIAANAPRFAGQALGDGPLPVGEILIGVEIALMLLALSSSATGSIIHEYRLNGFESRVGTLAQHLAKLLEHEVAGYPPGDPNPNRDPDGGWCRTIRRIIQDIRNAGYSEQQLNRDLRRAGFFGDKWSEIISGVDEVFERGLCNDHWGDFGGGSMAAS